VAPPRWSVALAALALVACRQSQPRLVLDGRPRLPDAEGIVEQISFDRITLDGGRSYGVQKDLQSFSTYDLAAVPMLQRLGQYVQLGLNGKKVAWLAGIGVVVRAPAVPPVVYFNGVLVRREGRRAVFRDGTVLQLGPGVASPVDPSPGEHRLVRAEIDPARHEVRAVVLP
jgi:hypothetical protein